MKVRLSLRVESNKVLHFGYAPSFLSKYYITLNQLAIEKCSNNVLNTNFGTDPTKAFFRRFCC
jgi:hypothetical protein